MTIYTNSNPLSRIAFAILILYLMLFAVFVSRAGGQDAGFDAWLTDLKIEAAFKGVSQQTLDDALSGLKPILRVIELDRNQPEFKLSLNEYLYMMVSKNRIFKARKKLKAHNELLTRVSEKYKVQPRFLVAIWGIESGFGRATGTFPVIGSLATLAYDGRRSAYFRKELIFALRILDQGHISITDMKGSWAGAMGQMQFMPSTFINYAIDFDDDGRINMWQKLGDIFASAANYLAKSGWRADQAWGREVKFPKNFNHALIGLTRKKGLREWQALGVRRADGRDLPTRNLESSIVRPDGPKGRSFVVYQNYRVLLKWNRSHKFATAVGILSDALRDY